GARQQPLSLKRNVEEADRNVGKAKPAVAIGACSPPSLLTHVEEQYLHSSKGITLMIVHDAVQVETGARQIRAVQDSARWNSREDDTEGVTLRRHAVVDIHGVRELTPVHRKANHV